jgi:predicted O-methyltransferase YrrM
MINDKLNRIRNRFQVTSAGYQNSEWHTDFLVQIAKTIRPQLYVEVGVHQAFTFNRVARFSVSAIGADINPNSLKWISSKNSLFVLGGSDEVVANLGDKKIDFLFIDADHRKEAVLNDFQTLEPYFTQDVIVAIHDTYPRSVDFIQDNYCSDSYKVPELLNMSSKWAAVTVPIHPGLTIVAKRGSQPAWIHD